MPEPLYTEGEPEPFGADDVLLGVRALKANRYDEDLDGNDLREVVEILLTALAEAGRLLPPGGEMPRTTEREIQVRVDVADEIAEAIERQLAVAKAAHYRAALTRAAAIAREHRLPPGGHEIEGAVAVEPRRLDSILSVRLGADLIAKLRATADCREVSVSDLLREGAEMVVVRYADETGKAS